MPLHGALGRVVRVSLRRVNPHSVLGAQTVDVRGRSVDRFRDEEAKVDGEMDRALVEHLVMQRAQANSVRHLIRTASLSPLNVGGFEAEGARVELQVEAADSTAEVVRPEHVDPKLRVARRAGRDRARGIESDCVEDVVVERSWEVLL